MKEFILQLKKFKDVINSSNASLHSVRDFVSENELSTLAIDKNSSAFELEEKYPGLLDHFWVYKGINGNLNSKAIEKMDNGVYYKTAMQAKILSGFDFPLYWLSVIFKDLKVKWPKGELIRYYIFSRMAYRNEYPEFYLPVLNALSDLSDEKEIKIEPEFKEQCTVTDLAAINTKITKSRLSNSTKTAVGTICKYLECDPGITDGNNGGITARLIFYNGKRNENPDGVK